jgi:dinuclear metal center YbgI/SA1388 family protein
VPVPLTDLIAFLDDLLDAERFEDYCPNGLQVPGPQQIGTVVTGVSAHAELFDRAIERNADLVLVHHGLFWKGQPLEVTAAMHLRLGKLFANDIALAAYHLPLDAHPAHGNNALLALALGLDRTQPLGDIGARGTLSEPVSLQAFGERLADALGGRAPLVIDGGAAMVSNVGVVTGAGTDYIAQALAAGCDTFVTGEPAERAYGAAKDNSIHFLAGGHHATETFGVRRLGELLASKFGVEHHFEDVVNPI